MQRFSGVMVTVLMVVSLWGPSSHAQNNEAATYISVDGAFTFSYPEVWVQKDYGFGIFLSNTDKLPARFEDVQVEEGELQVRVYPPISVGAFRLGDDPISLETKAWALIYRLVVDITPDELVKRSVEITELAGQEIQLISAITIDDEYVTAMALELDGGFYAILIAITTNGEWELFEADVLEVASTIKFEDHPPILWPEEGLPLDETIMFVDEALTFNYPTGWTLVNFVEENAAFLANSPSAILTGNAMGFLMPDQFVGVFHLPARLYRVFPELDQWNTTDIARKLADAQRNAANISIAPPYDIEQLMLGGRSAVVLHDYQPESTCEKLAYSVVVIELAPQTFAAFELMACPATLLSFEEAVKAIASTLQVVEE